jgi:hypothetical protein
MHQPEFVASDALTTCLTVESLLFAGLGGALAIAVSTGLPRPGLPTARLIAWSVFVLLSVVGSGACVAWIDLFLATDQVRGASEWIPRSCILIGALGQPVVAFLVARSMTPRR